MELATVASLLLIAVPAIVMLWPKIKPMLGGLNIFNKTNVPPHEAVEILIEFFKKQESKEGLDCANQCGKLIYDALTGNIGTKTAKGTK